MRSVRGGGEWESVGVEWEWGMCSGEEWGLSCGGIVVKWCVGVVMRECGVVYLGVE